MRFETSVLAAIAALPSVDANIAKHDDGIGSPRDATNPGSHDNHELAPAESPRAWAKITKPDAVKKDDGTLLIPTKIGESELVSMESPSFWSESHLQTMLKTVPLTTPPDDDNAKNQDFLYLGILEKNLLPKEEVKAMEDILLEDEFQMFERDLEEIQDCEMYCAKFTELPEIGSRQELYNVIRNYCSNTVYSPCSFGDAHPIQCWNIHEIDDMTNMFSQLKTFNEPLKCWNMMKVATMVSMFHGAQAFNQPVNKWNVSKVTDMSKMFYDASNFNQSLNEWDVTNVGDMNTMFSYAAAFNQPVNKWDVTNVGDMNDMFSYAAAFNQPVNKWDVSKVEDMSGMFSYTYSFNQPVNEWDVTKVGDMALMFSHSAFNQPVNEWDVTKVGNMINMFFMAEAFNQCLGTWPAKVLASTSPTGMFKSSACPYGSDRDPSKHDTTWCQNDDQQCTATLPKPFSIYKVERATNEEGQYAKVNNDSPVTIETFFRAKNEKDVFLELFHNVANGAPCTQGTPLNSGTTPTLTKIKDNAEDSTSIYKVQYVIDVTNLVNTPAYDSSTSTIKICTTVAKKTNHENGSQESKYVSVVETSFTLTVKMEGNLSSDFVQTVTIEFDSEGGQQVGTVTNSVPVESFLCAPSRNADTKFKMGDEFGVCVRPDANAISNGYSVTSFESVECSTGDASTQTLISGSAIQDGLTKVLNDASTALDKDGNTAGARAAGFTSLVTAGFFVDKLKTSFRCTGTVSLTKTDQSNPRNRQRLLQEDSKTSSPFSTTIVLDTKNVASLSADASMVSCVGAPLLSILLAIM